MLITAIPDAEILRKKTQHISYFEEFNNAGDTRSGNLYRKLAPVHVIKIVRFDMSAVFESLPENCTEYSRMLPFDTGFWYKYLESMSAL